MAQISNAINTVSQFDAPDIECDGCAAAIKNARGNPAGVTGVAVDVEEKRVAVTHEPTTASVTVLIGALDRAGFAATARK